MDDIPNTLYVFPDTNVLVQCKALGELDWSCLGSYSKFVLILARPVIGEIDQQKGGSGRLAKRARVANSLLRRFLEEDLIAIPAKKKSIEVVLFSGDHLRASQGFDDQLDYSTADDKLVGTVHKYQHDHPDRPVVFLSHDTGPLMTAKRLGVPFKQVPDDWILPPETDEDQKQIKALQEQLKQREGQQPDCQIEFVDAPWTITVPRYRALTEAQIDTLIEDVEHRHPCATVFETEPPRRNPYDLVGFQIGGKRFVPVSPGQISEYHDGYQKWVQELRDALARIHEKVGKSSAMPWIEIGLKNTGTGPARNVDVRVEVQGKKFSIFAPSDEIEKVINAKLRLPEPPAVPKGRSVDAFSINTIGIPSAQFAPRTLDLLRAVRAPDVNKFYWKDRRPETPVYQVSRECGEWRHHDDQEFVRVRLYLGESHDVLRDAIRVTIRASNLTQPLQAVQPVRIEYEDVDLFADAEQLVDSIGLLGVEE